MHKELNSPRFANLPTPVSAFIGRDKEIREIKQLILESRLITLTGTAGSGKTRLAIKIAQELQGRFNRRIWFIELASLTDSSLILQKIASALNIREQSDHSLTDLLVSYLSIHPSLLVLDNCEHLIESCAETAEHLLVNCANLRILTTSRENLGITGEVAWIVPPLSLPKLQAWKETESAKNNLEQYEESESVRLFIARARAYSPGFKLTTNNDPWVAEICRRLDGLPLAIELAASHISSLSAKEIAQRLDNRFQLLNGGSRTAPHRQQTLRATLDWSYDLLSMKEKIVLQRLSVFAGGATIESAEAICTGGQIEPVDVLTTISHLVDKSLVIADKLESGETRYRLLETIREYALDNLARSRDKLDVQNKHLEFFALYAEEGDRKIKGAEQVIWSERLELEHDNFRAALKWALESNHIEAGLRLATSLMYFWYRRGQIMENADWFEKYLNREQDIPLVLEARALMCDSIMVHTSKKDDDDRSLLLLEKSLRLFREMDDRSGMATALNLLGVRALQKSELEKAEQLLSESLELHKELGDPWGIAFTMQNYPPLALLKKNLAEAEIYAQETIGWFERAGDKHNVARSLGDLADIAQLEGDTERAIELNIQVLQRLIQSGDTLAILEVWETLTVLAVEQRDYIWGARLSGAAEVLHEEMGIQRHRLQFNDYQRAVSTIHKNISEAEFKQASEEGRSKSRERDFDYVVQKSNLLAAKADSTAEEKVWFQLTARERDVMRLLALGHSNLEISQELFLSEKTIRNYVSNIYRKLDTTNRGETILLARKLISASEE